MKPRILVIGSRQFVGAGVVSAMTTGGWAIPVPLSGPSDALDATSLDGIDAVFNGTIGSPRLIGANAASLTRALEDARSNIRVVHLSSMTVYGSQVGNVPESTAVRADLGQYGAAQIQGELSAGRHPHSVILRPGCEVGPRCPDWTERIARLLRAHRLGDLGAAGDGICNLLYIGDLISAVRAALTLPGIDGQAFNLAMRAPPTWNEYLTAFARALGAVPVSRISAGRLKLEARLLAVPLKLVERAGPIGRWASLPPAITPSLLAACSQTLRLDVGKAERLLGLSWTPLTEALRAAAAG